MSNNTSLLDLGLVAGAIYAAGWLLGQIARTL